MKIRFAWLPLLLSAASFAGAAGLGACAADPASSSPVGNDDAGPTGNADAGGEAATTSADGSSDAAAVLDAEADGATKADAALTQGQSYCDAVASHGTCPGRSPEPCSAQDKCNYGALMTPAALAAFNACYASPSCKGDDDCAIAAGLAAGGTAATTYVQSCNAKAASCGSSDELCDPAVFGFTGVGDAMSACLTQACGALDACFKAALKPLADCK